MRHQPSLRTPAIQSIIKVCACVCACVCARVCVRACEAVYACMTMKQKRTQHTPFSYWRSCADWATTRPSCASTSQSSCTRPPVTTPQPLLLPLAPPPPPSLLVVPPTTRAPLRTMKTMTTKMFLRPLSMSLPPLSPSLPLPLLNRPCTCLGCH